MASKTTLTAKNLEALGAERLAELLLEVSAGDALSKRHLRRALALKAGPQELTQQVRKRLSAIVRSRAFVDWTKRKALIHDLDAQRFAIAEDIAKDSPRDALDLMWRFLGLAAGIYERCDDSSGMLGWLFSQALDNLGEIARAAQPDKPKLAKRCYMALRDNGYGQYDGLIVVLSQALGTQGLEKLRDLFLAETSLPPKINKYGFDNDAIITKMALQDIADALGDVDGYIAQQDADTLTRPHIAAEIALRLLTAGREREALTALDATNLEGVPYLLTQWENAKVQTLDALGQTDDAQVLRWSSFKRTFSAETLRTYLDGLADFDDVEAENKAMDYALKFENVHMALKFLIDWPELEKTAILVKAHFDEFDGHHYELLTPAADALTAKYPLAATLLHRTLISFALDKSRYKRYKHAARHLGECESLAEMITDFGHFQNHEIYLASLKSKHGLKTSFWAHVENGHFKELQ